MKKPLLLFCVLLVCGGGCRPRQQDFLTPQERSWLDANYRHITVAPDPRWNAAEDIEQQKIYKGLTSDYLKLVEKKLGVRFLRLYTKSWDQVLEAEKQGKIDIHPVLVQSKERSKKWLFTKPYLRIPMVVLARESLKKHFKPSQMAKMKMGVGHGYGVDEFVAENCRGYNIVPVESDRFGMIKASLGEIDLMITDLATASHYIESLGLTNLRLVATLGTLYEFSFASRKDEPLLNSILNKALKQLTPEERNLIYSRWIIFDMEPFYKDRSFWFTATLVMFFVMVIITAILFWNSTLQAEVKAKTVELRRINEELEQRVDERTEQLSEINRLLQQQIEERAELARDLLHISSNERARIGRELHDSIGQEMVGVTFLCRALEGSLVEDKPEAAAQASRIAEQVESIISGMKRIVRGLLPVDIMDKGLVVALERLAREAAEMYELDCRFVCGQEDELRLQDNALATNVYRIAQEAVNNAAKHSRASLIEIGLVYENGKGVLTVRDNGSGIVNREEGGAGMGLGIMRYRAELARGSLQIKSTPGKGTEVVCVFDPAAEVEGAS